MVDKKHLKIGVVVFAIAALVIGLSVGLTQKSNKSTNNLSSSQAYGAYDVDSAEYCYGGAGGSGKSGKSSSSSSSSSSSKSGKSDRRALNVPGTEDAEASAGIRRKLRDQLVERELSSKSKKASKSSPGPPPVAKAVKEPCYCEGKSAKSKGESKSKSGKSGGSDSSDESSGKSGKSGGSDSSDESKSKSGKSGGSDSDKSKSKGKSEKGSSSSAAKSGKSSPTMDMCGQGSPPDITETFSTQPATFATPPDFEDIPSPSPTEGGTTTVATETESLFSQGDDRGGD